MHNAVHILQTTIQDAMQCKPQCIPRRHPFLSTMHTAHFNAMHTTMHTTMPPPFPPFPSRTHASPHPCPSLPRHPVSSHLLSLVYTARQKVMFANFCADSDLMHNMHCGELKLVKLFMPIIVTTAKYIAIEPWKRDRQC